MGGGGGDLSTHKSASQPWWQKKYLLREILQNVLFRILPSLPMKSAKFCESWILLIRREFHQLYFGGNFFLYKFSKIRNTKLEGSFSCDEGKTSRQVKERKLQIEKKRDSLSCGALIISPPLFRHCDSPTRLFRPSKTSFLSHFENTNSYQRWNAPSCGAKNLFLVVEASRAIDVAALLHGPLAGRLSRRARKLVGKSVTRSGRAGLTVTVSKRGRIKDQVPYLGHPGRVCCINA